MLGKDIDVLSIPEAKQENHELDVSGLNKSDSKYQFKIYHMKRLIQIPDFDCTVTEEYGRQLLSDMRTYVSDSDNSRETSTHLPRDRWQES